VKCLRRYSCKTTLQGHNISVIMYQGSPLFHDYKEVIVQSLILCSIFLWIRIRKIYVWNKKVVVSCVLKLRKRIICHCRGHIECLDSASVVREANGSFLWNTIFVLTKYFFFIKYMTLIYRPCYFLHIS
jgi:hypothetical protein